ncbi:hypothetical protein P378_12055 [Desulforamulus profundi]|uniref:Rod shape-determining protein MreD n=1 Tax=Desulforamulus profundi TaxID=1383067 RepID=A0A2C6MA62_9FIRM|nr:hypothetical protein [Desulforamulus profundi]PHJ38069.1 hypothetical protein P378_12055 [Desulforamulus profundi]
MGNIPFSLYISLAYLEGISVLFFLFVFLKVHWSKKELIIFSGAYAISTFLLRKLPISFGIHSLILVCLVSGFLTYYYKTKLSSAVFGLILVFSIIIITEIISAFLISKLFLLNYNTILGEPLWWFLSGLPHVVIIIILSMLIRKFGR